MAEWQYGMLHALIMCGPFYLCVRGVSKKQQQQQQREHMDRCLGFALVFVCVVSIRLLCSCDVTLSAVHRRVYTRVRRSSRAKATLPCRRHRHRNVRRHVTTPSLHPPTPAVPLTQMSHNIIAFMMHCFTNLQASVFLLHFRSRALPCCLAIFTLYMYLYICIVHVHVCCTCITLLLYCMTKATCLSAARHVCGVYVSGVMSHWQNAIWLSTDIYQYSYLCGILNFRLICCASIKTVFNEVPYRTRICCLTLLLCRLLSSKHRLTLRCLQPVLLKHPHRFSDSCELTSTCFRLSYKNYVFRMYVSVCKNCVHAFRHNAITAECAIRLIRDDVIPLIASIVGPAVH